MRTMPPVATTRSGSSTIGLATRRSASSSSSASASIAQTYGYRAAFTPQLSASALPPFSFSITVSSGLIRDA
jgi:hypothetical protein